MQNVTLRNTAEETYSLYIHFPFCIRKCPFCPIKTVPYSAESASAYVTALKSEIAWVLKSAKYRGVKVDCIHFGGGTPSLLKVSELDSILNMIRKFTDIEESEVVFEVHPKFMTDGLLSYLSGLKYSTVNLGVQSFNDAVLCSMNRYYRKDDILRMIEKAKCMVHAVGIDYICGWSDSDLKDLENDFIYIKQIKPDHISQYPLYIHSTCIDDSNEIDKIKLNAVFESFLTDMGYRRYSVFHYENGEIISHKYGRMQLNGGKWIGFGAGAYTYLGNIMCMNAHVPEYLKGNFVSMEDRLDDMGRFLWEFLFLLRTTSVSRENIIRKYGRAIESDLDSLIRKLLDYDYIKSMQDMNLTWKGIIHLNYVEQIVTSIFLKDDN